MLEKIRFMKQKGRLVGLLFNHALTAKALEQKFYLCSSGSNSLFFAIEEKFSSSKKI